MKTLNTIITTIACIGSITASAGIFWALCMMEKRDREWEAWKKRERDREWREWINPNNT